MHHFLGYWNTEICTSQIGLIYKCCPLFKKDRIKYSQRSTPGPPISHLPSSKQPNLNVKMKVCQFDELPLRKGDPPHSAWGLWENSQLGSLNYLTDEKVLQAASSELKTGVRISLK